MRPSVRLFILGCGHNKMPRRVSVGGALINSIYTIWQLLHLTVTLVVLEPKCVSTNTLIKHMAQDLG